MSIEQSQRRGLSLSVYSQNSLLIGTIALLYFIGVLLSRLYNITPYPFSPFWIPGGLLLAALLLIDRRIWGLTLALVFATGILSYVVTGIAFGTSVVFAFANCLESGLAALLIARFVGLPVTLSRVQDVVGFACWSVISAIITGLLIAAIAKLFSDRSFWQVWLMWSTGHSASTLLVSSVILAWTAHIKDGKSVLPERGIESLVLYSSTVAATFLIFGSTWPLLSYSYQVLPFVIWAALRFSPRCTTTLLFIMSFIIFWGTISEYSPFSALPQPLWWNVFTAQHFLVVILLSALVISAVMNERHQAKEALKLAYADLELRVVKRTAELVATNERLQKEITERQRAESFLDTILQQMPSGVFIIDGPSGNVILINDEAQRLLGNNPKPTDTLDDNSSYSASHTNERSYDAIKYPIMRALFHHETVLS